MRRAQDMGRLWDNQDPRDSLRVRVLGLGHEESSPREGPDYS
jgi:hypothetical protein